MRDAVPYFPGDNVRRQYGGYEPYQEMLWQAFDDTYMARAFGFDKTRMPSPGMQFDQASFDKWKAKFLCQYGIEATRDVKTRALTERDIDDTRLLYLYERMCQAMAHKRIIPSYDD